MTPSKSLKIVHVTTWAYPDKFGGAERVVHGIAKAQAELGHRVTVFTGNFDDRPWRETLDGFELVRYPAPRSRGFEFFLDVVEAVRHAMPWLAKDADVVHAHQPASGVAAIPRRSIDASFLHAWSFYAPWSEEREVERAARRGLRSWFDRAYSALVRMLDRDLIERADLVVALSEFSRAQIASLAPDHARRVEIVPPGVDACFAPGDRPASRAHLGFVAPAGLLQIATVRRLVKRMGLDDLLRGLSIARSFGVRAHLTIAGEGPERAALEDLVRTLGLESEVRFLGRVSDADLPHVYRAADLFVLPTRALEGFGMATLEAMACGVPVLATEVGATPELLRRFDALLAPVRPGPDSIALGILEFVARREAIESAARSISQRVHVEASWAATAKRLVALYEARRIEKRA